MPGVRQSAAPIVAQKYVGIIQVIAGMKRQPRRRSAPACDLDVNFHRLAIRLHVVRLARA